MPAGSLFTFPTVFDERRMPKSRHGCERLQPSHFAIHCIASAVGQRLHRLYAQYAIADHIDTLHNPYGSLWISSQWHRCIVLLLGLVASVFWTRAVGGHRHFCPDFQALPEVSTHQVRVTWEGMQRVQATGFPSDRLVRVFREFVLQCKSYRAFYANNSSTDKAYKNMGSIRLCRLGNCRSRRGSFH